MKATLDSSFLKIRFSYLYALNIGANIFGFLIIAQLNLFTPLEFFKIQRAFLLAGGWVTIISFYPLVICLGIILQYIVQRPISDMINRLRLGLKIEANLEEKAKRCTLNLPVIIGTVNFAMWIGLTALLGIFFMIFRDAPLRIGFFVVFRGFMVGYIAAIVSFFMVEAHVRRRLIRFLFPEGKLAAVPGTVKFSILRRIRVLYGVGTLAPMIILVGTLAYILWEMEGAGVAAADFGRELLFFSIVLCVIFVFVGLRLNVLSGKSIIEPITDMMVLVRRVRKGYFKQKVRVVSNDELGVLADGRYQEYRKTGLQKGQIILLGSDGLWEARNPKGEMFGKDSICQIIRSYPEATARELLTSCFNALNIFLGDRAPEDDVTLVVIKITKN